MYPIDHPAPGSIWFHSGARQGHGKGDTKNFKIYAYDGDPEAVKVFEKFGFNPVVMTATDVMPSLQSGLINSFPSTRLGALYASSPAAAQVILT